MVPGLVCAALTPPLPVDSEHRLHLQRGVKVDVRSKRVTHQRKKGESKAGEVEIFLFLFLRRGSTPQSRSPAAGVSLHEVIQIQRGCA